MSDSGADYTRDGFSYYRCDDTIPGTVIYRISALRPFTVDGITYDPACLDNENGMIVNPMISTYPDGYGTRNFRHYPANPPTDDELDHWVHTGWFGIHIPRAPEEGQ